MVEEIHKGDIDTKFLVTIKDGDAAVDISTASSKELIFEKSDGSIIAKNATFNTDGTDGKMYYKTIQGDLDMIGSWKIQGEVTIGDAFNHSDTKPFEVYKNLR